MAIRQTSELLPAPDPETLPLHGTCLFLDVDGTLLDLAATPDDVHVTGELVTLLGGIHARLDGALALISGRPLEQLDLLFSPLLLPAAGIHGFERRSGPDQIHRGAVNSGDLGAIREQLAAGMAARPDLLLEDKGAALALHYRADPRARDYLIALFKGIAAPLLSGFELLEGDMVLEIKPASRNKAHAIEDFMAEAPFRGRTPIYIGDDNTDSFGFEAVRRYGGIDIVVGDRVPARWYLQDPLAVRNWLRRFMVPESGRFR